MSILYPPDDERRRNQVAFILFTLNYFFGLIAQKKSIKILHAGLMKTGYDNFNTAFVLYIIE